MRSRSRSGAARSTSRPRRWSRPTRAIPGNDPRYAELSPAELPLTECLKDTIARFMPFWDETLAPSIRSEKRVVVAAHGNSIRAIVKYLDDVSDEEIVGLNIPTGIPLVYDLDADLRADPARVPRRPGCGRPGDGRRGKSREGQNRRLTTRTRANLPGVALFRRPLPARPRWGGRGRPYAVRPGRSDP